MELPRFNALSRTMKLRCGLAVVLILLFLPALYSAVAADSVEVGPGTVTTPAENTTYVSVQGFHFAGYGRPKKPARLLAADEQAELEWLFDGDAVGASWFYEVDQLKNGHLFVTATHPDGTILFEYDPVSQQPVWTYNLPGIMDTHNANLLADRRILVANMRAYNGSVSNDRLYIENTTTGESEWEWLFRDHYPAETDGGHDDDWTHVNDVDFIGEENRYILTSPRNFDQVIVVDRETDAIVMQLGSDDDHATLFEQHNPEYLERDDGTPVIIVGDSENDRVVEYERDCGTADPRLGANTPPSACEWDLVWSVEGFNWPRDADRLPNGNTLVTDTLNHRVVEITPEGEVVWEFYAAWAPYEAERGAEGANGPTMSDHGTTGVYTVSGGGDAGPASRYHVADAISDTGSHTPWPDQFDHLATRYSHIEPFFRPVGIGSWAFLSLVVALILGIGWASTEVIVHRHQLRTAFKTRFQQ